MLVTVVFSVPMRNKYYWQQHFEGEMYERRLAAGPEPERPRSAWNWYLNLESIFLYIYSLYV